MDTDKYMTIMEAARLKGVSRQAVVQAIDDNRLRHERVFGRRVVCRADVEEWQPRADAGRPRKSRNCETGGEGE